MSTMQTVKKKVNNKQLKLKTFYFYIIIIKDITILGNFNLIMCSENNEDNFHGICFTNIKENEEITYNLLLVNGYITTINNHKCLASKIQVHLSNHYQLEFDVINSNFKCLIELKHGENQISFEFCNVKIKLNVNFTIPTTKFAVMPLYIICTNHNGHFQAPEGVENTPEIACAKIAFVSKLMQTFYATKLFDLGFNQKTFKFFKTDLNLVCEIFYSKLDVEVARRMTQADLWSYFGREIMESPLGDDNLKYLAFLSCTWYNGYKYIPNEHTTHEDILSLTDAYVALGGGGLALFGSGCLHTWPQSVEECISYFRDETKIDKRLLMDDSNYRGTYGACFSTTLGSVCHELGHCFNLGHTDVGVMGRGFDNIHRVFCISTQSVRNPVFNKCGKILNSFTKINNEKQLSSYNDFTFFTKNCGLILNAHRWFQNCDTDVEGCINYNKETRVVNSTNGIVLVEIRANNSEAVINWWEFSQKIPMNLFRIPITYFDVPDNIIFVIDSKGGILKTDLS